jgi:hypothetical protein
MSVIRIVVILAGIVAAGTGAGLAAEPSPYAGLDSRPVKALSAEQIKGYLAGDGMMQALPAELNHYPGPRHVIALAGRLGLNEGQLSRIRRLEADMTGGAAVLGRAIVDQERALDRLFATGSAREVAVREAVSEIARLQGALRYTHLKYHLIVKSIVTPDQVAHYDRLRGYVRSGNAGDAGHDGHHPR